MSSVNIIPSDSSEDNKRKGKLEFPGPKTNERGLVLTNHEDMDVLIASPSSATDSPAEATGGTNLPKGQLPQHFENMRKRTGFKILDYTSSVQEESSF